MKKFRAFLLIVLILPIMFIFSACDQKVVTDIEYSTSNGNYDIYTVKYSDGSENTFTIKNGTNGRDGSDGQDGSDGKDLTFNDIYQTAQANGYTGTINEFMQDYLNGVTLTESNDVEAVNKALFSVVAVSSEFVVKYSNISSGSYQTKFGNGAGVIFRLDKESGDAYIMTNYHVVYYSKADNKLTDRIYCYLFGSPIVRTKKTTIDESGTETEVRDDNGYNIIEYDYNYAIPCEFVGGSMTYDIAVLKVTASDVIKNSNARAVDITDSDDVIVGETAIAVGNAEGLGISATKGIVSTDGEYIEMTLADDKTKQTNRVIRIDAAINGGNSGGGLFNDRGELLGIVNAKLVSSSIENIGYAIPSNVAIRVAENVLRNAENHNQKAYKAVLGVTVDRQNIRAVYDAQTDAAKIVEDLYIAAIDESSAFVNSTLQVGDKIESLFINNKEYTFDKFYSFADLTWLLNVGDIVGIKVEGAQSPIYVTMPEGSFSEIE